MTKYVGMTYPGTTAPGPAQRVEVLGRPWLLRSTRPMTEALGDVSGATNEFEPDTQWRPMSDTREIWKGRQEVTAAYFVGLIALCVLPALVEVLALVVAWPFWLVALRFARVPRTVVVREGSRVVHARRVANRAEAEQLVALWRERVGRGEPVEPEPTDFSDLLVRPRRGRRAHR